MGMTVTVMNHQALAPRQILVMTLMRQAWRRAPMMNPLAWCPLMR